MSVRPRYSILSLQMGQEVIYLLLTFSLIASIVMLMYFLINKNDKPLIINLDEADGYYFTSGKSDLSAEFRARLSNNIIPELRRYGDRFDVDLVEVIGHTDETNVYRQRGKFSNLDRELIPFLRGDGSVIELEIVDNVGLGIARSAEVARYLIRDGRLNHFAIVPMSAGQVIARDGKLATGTGLRNDRTRRRIEIRLRKRSN